MPTDPHSDPSLTETPGPVSARYYSLLDTLLDNLPMGVFMVDVPGGKPIVANRVAGELLGRGVLPDASRENLAEVYAAYLWPGRERYPVERMPIVRGMLGETSYVEDMWVLRPDGTGVLLEVFGCPVRSPEGRVEASMVCFRDITGRRRSEEALRLGSENTRALLRLNQMSEAPPQEITDFALEEAVRLTGSSLGYLAFLNEDETVMTMHSWSRAALAECAVPDMRFVYPVAQTGLWGEAIRQRRAVITNNYEAANPWKKGLPDGHVAVRRHMNVPIFSGERIVALAGVGNKQEPYTDPDMDQIRLLMDAMWRLLERQRAQQHLAEARRLESVGRLAGGVAHDFNNLLTVISGYAHMLLAESGPGDAAGTKVQEIVRASERAAVLVQQLLAYGRKQVLRPRTLDLNVTLQELLPELERLAGKGVAVTLRRQSGLGWVRADPAQLGQVISHLVANARDAMPLGGTILLETANVTFDSEYAESRAGLAPGEYVRLRVADDGVGMDEQTRRRLFEPFFTTKEMGQGAGMSLPAVHGVVVQSGGYVEVSSEVGRGTSFDVLLPQVARPEDAASLHLSPEGGGEPLQATILVVEDNDSVRELTAASLETLGYRVLRAENGAAALDRSAAEPGPIHVLVSDVVMPGMNGVELGRRLRMSRPHLRALFMSGYPEDVVQLHGALDEGAAFLQKPFPPSLLAAKVREILRPSAHTRQ